MSASRLNLKSPPVIAVVVVLFGVIGYVNFKTFGPVIQRNREQNRRTEVRVQARPTLPSDMEVLLEEARGASPAALKFTREADLPNPQRDPFMDRPRKSPGTIALAPGHTRSTRKARPGELSCDAVLLGGGRAVVIINGKSYRVGDKVGKLVVSAIGTPGVKLEQPDGSNRFLPVTSPAKDKNAYRVVTRVQDEHEQGKTTLEENSRTERKEP